MPAKKPLVKSNSKTKKYKKTDKPVKSAKATARSANNSGTPRSQQPFNQFFPFFSGMLAVFTLFCYIFPGASGVVGKAVRSVFFGTFGIGALLLPVLLMALAFFWFRLVDSRRVLRSFIYGTLMIYFFSVFCGVPVINDVSGMSAGELYNKCSSLYGGGVVGISSAVFFAKGIGAVFTAILSFLWFIVFGLFAFGITPVTVIAALRERAERIRLENAESTDNGEKEAFIPPVKTGKTPVYAPPVQSQHAVSPDKKKAIYDFDSEEDDIVPGPVKTELTSLLDEDDGVEQYVKSRADKYFEDGVLTEPNKRAPEKMPAERVKPVEHVKPVTLEAKKQPVGTPVEQLPTLKEPPVEPAYRFPPVTLLHLDPNPKSTAANDEIRENSRKIIDTLASFGIKVTLENVSCGPTVTRYELRPAPGVKIVRIENLIDDLARSLATGGVRFERTIEGCETIGIEVPNKSIATVYIRSLIDSEEFKKSESKVNCALGVDVSGKPIFLNIQKMPHLLIAGATGMGKSVCINSIIISLLYKASPDDVKLIMIDPKKVEFVPYSGIPHLLVPVITDPKKAAGALNWLVVEMERRYDLIEAAGCREIFGYNASTVANPEREKLPQIVIIIDELADLMMSAKDSVETSICRIAQKARAAGMYLIIGTQRPTVNIITGSIKANIPSRLACKTFSGVDSRTILDSNGAEKLMGRGDILYFPVGAMKQIRLQGAFVSDSEVEAVVSFVKSQGVVAKDSRSIMSSIEKAAENIQPGKKKFSVPSYSSSDGDGSAASLEGADELLMPAIDIAFDTKKISTSLLQRKLSIGYGRAASIIDTMQSMGICSSPNGGKPREITMTREQFEARYGENSDSEEDTDE